MANNKQIPEIRFSGFTDAWEQRKLGELSSTTIGEFVIKTKQNPNSSYPVFNGGVSNTGFYNEFNKEGDHIIISARGANAGYINIYKGKYWAGNSCYSVSINESSKQNIDFIYQEMKRNQHLFTDYQQSASIPAVSKADVEKFRIKFPSFNEQQQIGAFFKNLDDLITLHQRECDKLMITKKSMLEKMFPKNNEVVPEIRFSGFTDAWEQRKLGELGSLKNGMNFSKDAMGHGFPFVNLQNIFGKNVIDFTDLGQAEASQAQLNDYNLQQGDVLFVRSSVKLEGVGEAALVSKTLSNTTYSGFIIRFRDEKGLDDDFKRFVFSTAIVRKQIMSQATNSANKNISQPVLANLEVVIPKLAEQQQIGAFFKNLDDLITLHQRELEKLKNIKKSMLEKMFV